MTQPCPFGPLFFLSSAAVAEGAAEEAEGTRVQSTPLLLVATPACSVRCRVKTFQLCNTHSLLHYIVMPACECNICAGIYTVYTVLNVIVWGSLLTMRYATSCVQRD